MIHFMFIGSAFSFAQLSPHANHEVLARIVVRENLRAGRPVGAGPKQWPA
jgi:hypothetical protein